MKQAVTILIIASTSAIAIAGLLLFQPEAEKIEVVRPIASVEVIAVQPETVTIQIRSQGTVMPVTETDISMEVSGRVCEISENFRAGNRFHKGELLLRIEREDYEAALAMRNADLANARLALAEETALAEQALEDWNAMGQGSASALTLREPQLARAIALVKSAEAAVKRAERDLARTEIRAPYDGLVLNKNVDFGQYVAANPTSPIAQIYSTELAEVRLPISLDDALFLKNPSESPATVRLFRETANGIFEWSGRFARVEATVDPSNRLIYAIAELDEPFLPIAGSSKLPMKRGLFVDAVIDGRELSGVFSLPRYALRDADTVYIVSDDNRLHRRKVEIIQSDTQRTIISAGLEAGERVVTSPVAYFTENMPVTVLTKQP